MHDTWTPHLSIVIFAILGSYFEHSNRNSMSFLLEILKDCIVFLNEKIYISALYRRHKCAVQVKCSTSISVLYK